MTKFLFFFDIQLNYRENFDKICSFLSIFASKRKLKANSKL
ncbi:hypothetical protein HMPREF0105_2181 [Bacteroides sp. 3_1_33FAA]|uniref:Uncharacterized protein n=1 Tax=Phocaeicola dorei DSM 17855 TaxID=483217 RepID=B6VX05_9BACT|nr:hypothetical protein BACDOR_01698 [Phocaeicola dorei DSM 17855]EEZ21627.1 hypothetical protein HMPREF0105_2181 [Bacteroides sp. 3_1_33FAA]